MTAAIVIPVYKELADVQEKYAFWQGTEVFDNYPVILVVPQSLNTSYYEALTSKKLIIKRFDDQFFKNIQGYNKLLINPSFYRSFLNYDYMLIYQLDAWVFRDELADWINKGYDYVGAPWLQAPPIGHGKKPIVNLSKRLVNKVGNGGLSLRKVKSHIKWCWWLQLIFKFLPKNEDMLWTLFVPFKKPSALEALHFAFEQDPKGSFELTAHQLPFGCHAWFKYDRAFWSSYIQQN